MKANRSLGMVMKEVDEDLALFLEMRRSGKEKYIPLKNSNELDDPLESKTDSSSVSETTSTTTTTTMPNHNLAADFLSSETEKIDYDWLLSPPCTTLFPSSEMQEQKSAFVQVEVTNSHPTTPKLTPENPPSKFASRINGTLNQPALSNDVDSSITRNRKPSSSGGSIGRPSSKSATPNGRPSLPAASKPSRSSTPISRAAVPYMKPKATLVRSSTPTRAAARSSTPTGRAPIQATSKLTSRSVTPNHRSSVSSSVSAVPAQTSSKSGSVTLKTTLSRGTSSTVKSRPRRLSEMPGISHDAPSNLTSLHERPASVSKGRLSAPRIQSTSTETTSNGRLMQKSCSPSRRYTPNGSTTKNASSVLTRSLSHSDGSDDVNPLLVGTKMVERVVNMRKLAPPKSDDHFTCQNNSGKLSSLQDKSRLGRTLSKSSLDMALRHMDIRQSISGNLRPVVTKLPPSSAYGSRSGSKKSMAANASDSPFAVSSNASSELSVNTPANFLDQIEREDNFIGNERGQSFPNSPRHE